MPTYEYRCSEGHAFERFQRMSDAPLSECPECGAPAERLLSGGAGFVFKGSGFYITDYRSDSYRNEAKAEREGASDGAKSGKSEGSASTETKEAKPAAKPAEKKTGGGSSTASGSTSSAD